MPKKYLYELKEMNDLFNEKCKEVDPNNNPIAKAQMLTTAERTNMFQDIINDYGARGWRIIASTPLSAGGAGGPFYFIFEKEVYGGKKTV